MTDYFMLDNRMWVSGWISEPNLYYYADVNKVITIKLVDVYGNYVTDSGGNPISLSYSAVTGVNNINLGDWLNANSSYVSDGVYILEINNGSQTFYVPLIITTAGSTLPIELEETQYIEKIIIYDKVTGISVELPPTQSIVPYTNRFTTYIWLYDPENKKGRIRIYGVQEDMDTGWARRGIWRVTISFSSLTDMLNFLVNHTYPKDYDSETLSAVVTIVSSHPSKASNILGFYGIPPIFGRADILNYKVTVDDSTSTYKIDIDVYARIGDLWEDFWFLLASMAGAASAGAIAGSALPGIGTATGAVVGALAGIAFFALSKVYGTDSWDVTEEEKQTVEDTAEQGKQNITEQYNNAVNDVNELYENGEITEHARDVILADLQALYNVAITAIDEIVEEAVKQIDSAFDRGYRKGVEESKMWIMGAGLGGIIVGMMLGKK